LRGRIAHITADGTAEPKLLLDTAKRLEPIDVPLAREVYLQALSSASYAGRIARDVDVLDVARAARTAPPPPGPARAADLLLDGLALLTTGELADAVQALRKAGNAFLSGETSVEEDLKWLGLSCATACATWDHESWHALATRQVHLERATGALAFLPIALNNLAILLVREGELDATTVLLAEAHAINDVAGSQFPIFGGTHLAALRGAEHDAAPRIEAVISNAASSGRGQVMRFATWALAMLYNGRGRYDQAFAAAQEADSHPQDWSRDLFLLELIESAARTGHQAVAHEALERLAQTTQSIGTDWPLGIEAAARALVTGSAVADDHYREAIERLERTPIRVDLARSQLLYGEWLRRENRRVDARHHLRMAHQSFHAMGAEGFADRAGRELAATGETVRKRSVATRDELTAQEAQIARLAAEGRTNPEIGAELYLSARTVEWHLRKVYPKLGINSRRDLRKALRQRRTVEASA
jgi:DNA-binding CsgD family transcriptional regulator